MSQEIGLLDTIIKTLGLPSIIVIRRGVMLAKAKLIESVIETEDAQKAYAFASLVSSGKTLNHAAREPSGSLQPQIDQAFSLETDQAY